jgi:hypothetical protein
MPGVTVTFSNELLFIHHGSPFILFSGKVKQTIQILFARYRDRVTSFKKFSGNSSVDQVNWSIVHNLWLH